MGDQERHMSCICKLTSVPEKTRLYWCQRNLKTNQSMEVLGI
jgi:hypothetical protein